jgi:hypothetical protein
VPKRRLLLIVLSVLLSISGTFALPRDGHSRPRSQLSSSNVSTSQKTVHVRSYTRKDGTVVQGYNRSASGLKAPRSIARVQNSTATSVLRDSNGRIKRSEEAKAQFERATGYPHGRPGYVVDHKIALACGGADAPSNMQWQTIAEGKAKDKTERIGCK